MQKKEKKGKQSFYLPQETDLNKDLEILLDVRDMFGNGMVEKINKGLCTFISYQFLKCKSLRRCIYFLYFHNIKITGIVRHFWY